MKLFSIEAKRRKFLVILFIAFAFSFGLSAFSAYQYVNSDLLAMEKAALAENAGYEAEGRERDLYAAQEDQKKGKADSEKIAFYQDWLAAHRELEAAYQADDPEAVIQASLKVEKGILFEKQEYGVLRYKGENVSAEQQARTVVKVCTILQEKGIKMYRNPKLEHLGYYDGAASVSNFLRSYLFLLLPLAVALTCSDLISGETADGSIKLLLSCPASRLSLLLRKYGCGILLSAFSILAACVGAFLGGAMFCGPGDIRYPVLAQKSFFQQGVTAYLPEWQIWARTGAVSLCAILFFAAVSLLISVFLKSGAASLALGALASAGGAAVCSQITAAAGYQGVPLYLPFTMSNGYAAAVGSVIKQGFAFQSDGAGLLSIASSSTRLIRNSYPGILSCAILLVWAVLLVCLTTLSFRKRDVT